MAEETNEEAEIEKLNQQIAEFEAASQEKEEEYGYPISPGKDNQYKFFKHIIDMKDSSKIGNINETELGNLKLSVRHYQDIALYAEAEKLDKVAKYLRDKAEIILATSTSKKGKLIELFVTQIKKEQKIVPQENKGGLFSKPKKEE
jgi:hypothetical protein